MSLWTGTDAVNVTNLNNKNVTTGGGNQTIEGIKTFVEFPVRQPPGMGNNWPTQDDQFATKAYVDNFASGAGLPLDVQGWSFDGQFSSLDYNTVNWSSGTVYLSQGNTYIIDSGSTGNMGAATYIYFQPSVSSTDLQISTNPADATGSGKILIAVAGINPDTNKHAEFQAFGGRGGAQTIITTDVLGADVVTANELAVNSVYAGAVQAGILTVSHLSFTPLYSVGGVNEPISTINASGEGITISASKITIAGTTIFTSGWASAANAESDINALNTYNGPVDAGATDNTVANQALADAATAIANAATAQAAADGKIVSFYQDSAPTADGIGDFWIDTNDDNKLYRWQGSSWVSVRDGSIADAQSDATTALGNAATAQATADGKITTFYQASPATADDAGDIWVDTDDGNRVYIATAAGSGSWVAVADITANNTANNTSNVGTLPTSTVQGWAHSSDTTKIDGGLVYVGSQLVVGTGNNVGVVSGSDATYRIWAGNATAASAPFSVTQAGVMYCSGATINGDVSADNGIKTQTISSNYMWLYYRSQFGQKRHTLDFWSDSSWLGGIFMDTNSTPETKIELYKYGVSGEGLRASYYDLELDGSGTDNLHLYADSITMSGSEFIDASRNLSNIGTITNSGLIDCGNYVDAASGFKVNGNTIVDSDRKAYLYDTYIASGSAIYNNGLQVVGARQTGISAMMNVSAPSNLDANTVTVAELADIVGNLINKLRTHGLVAN